MQVEPIPGSHSSQVTFENWEEYRNVMLGHTPGGYARHLLSIAGCPPYAPDEFPHIVAMPNRTLRRVAADLRSQAEYRPSSPRNAGRLVLASEISEALDTQVVWPS